MDSLRAKVRDVPDFPKKGIVFKDITPALEDPKVFRELVDVLAERWRGEGISKVVGIESRGFIVGAPLAYLLGAGLALVRKHGKLPYETLTETYALEYGEDRLQIHRDAVKPGERVLIVDDLLATGGTAQATAKLVQRLGGEIAGYSFLIELLFLPGRARLGHPNIHALLRYD
jgi:adenine phosphoribosyltransferase